MCEHSAEPPAYHEIPHPRWCERAACAIFRSEVCHRSASRTVGSDTGPVSVWLESWDDFCPLGEIGDPMLVVETGGRGCGASLAPSAAMSLILALASQVARLTGSPRGWRRLRVRRIGEQLDRINARMGESERISNGC